MVALVCGFVALCSGLLSAAEPPVTQVYFFTSADCPHCPPVAQQVNRLTTKDGWEILTLDLGKNQELAEYYGVKAIPTFTVVNIDGDEKKSHTMVAAGYSDDECRRLFERFRVRRRQR